MWRAAAVVLIALLLGGCAATPPPFEDADVRSGLRPTEVAGEAGAHVGERVIWGGTVVNVSNEPGSTLLEILAYPLDSGQRPDTDASAQGRFLAVEEGFLDPADYSAGRQVTVKGTLQQPRKGRIGEVEYTYPVVETEGLELWRPESRQPRTSPRVNFGIGVIFD